MRKREEKTRRPEESNVGSRVVDQSVFDEMDKFAANSAKTTWSPAEIDFIKKAIAKLSKCRGYRKVIASFYHKAFPDSTRTDIAIRGYVDYLLRSSGPR